MPEPRKPIHAAGQRLAPRRTAGLAIAVLAALALPLDGHGRGGVNEAFATPTEHGERTGEAVVGQIAPKFSLWTFDDTESVTPNSALQSAGAMPRGVIVSFYAYSCEVCKKVSLPALRSLMADKDASRGLAVILVAVGGEGDVINNQSVFDSADIKRSVGCADKFGVVAKRYDANPLPRTIILDAKLQVRQVYTREGADFLDVLRRDTAKL